MSEPLTIACTQYRARPLDWFMNIARHFHQYSGMRFQASVCRISLDLTAAVEARMIEGFCGDLAEEMLRMVAFFEWTLMEWGDVMVLFQRTLFVNDFSFVLQGGIYINL